MLKENIARFLKLDSLLENITGYVETKIEIMKLDLKEDVSKLVSHVSVLLIIIMTGIFFLLFLSVAVALEIASHLGNLAGFGIISAFYLIAVVVLYAKRASLQERIESEIKQTIKERRK